MMMFDTEGVVLAALIFVAAMLYASVGHAGASGYLAAMALFGVAPEVMKPTALTLNILVALIATFKFYRVGAFSWRIFLPLAAGSVPLAWRMRSRNPNTQMPPLGTAIVDEEGLALIERWINLNPRKELSP